MARRPTYTKVLRANFHNPDHVAGMGDRVVRGFQCFNKQCTNFIFVLEEDLGDLSDVSIDCDSCGHRHVTGATQTLYEYQLVKTEDGAVLEEGEFAILHDDYIRESERFKYCILCGALKPLARFGRHAPRASGRQGECSLCKQVYNSIKNQTRLVEQHREASQRRRLYTQFENAPKLDVSAIYQRFNSQCFKCSIDLSADLVADSLDTKLGNLDHTLPVYYLWPLTTANATLLCRKHNGEKAERWPAVYYTEQELRRLSVVTGIDYRTLAGPAHFNPEAIEILKDPAFVENLFVKFANYPEELLRLRNRVLSATQFDFLTTSPNLSPDWRVRADALHQG